MAPVKQAKVIKEFQTQSAQLDMTVTFFMFSQSHIVTVTATESESVFGLVSNLT